MTTTNPRAIAELPTEKKEQNKTSKFCLFKKGPTKKINEKKRKNIENREERANSKEIYLYDVCSFKIAIQNRTYIGLIGF